MKILVIQLARFGDIYQTWSTLRALRRSNPESEIHLLVRKRFSAATDGIETLDKIFELDSENILEPIFTTGSGEVVALDRLFNKLDQLKNCEYDQIINLSFSPLSSYMCKYLSQRRTQVSGYSRFDDGFLNIVDDTSAYFYGQVGIGKANKAHICEIFPAVAGVETLPEDHFVPEELTRPEIYRRHFFRNQISDDSYAVVHLGASQSQKCLTAQQWKKALKSMSRFWKGQVILVGSKSEKSMSDYIMEGEPIKNLHSLVGMTQLQDLFSLLKHSRFAIGCDSVIMQMASLTETMCVNISFPSVNFWETGPRTLGSRVVFFYSKECFDPDRLANEVDRFLRDKKPDPLAAIRNEDEIFAYTNYGIPSSESKWEWIKAIYMNESFPIIDDHITAKGLSRLHEVTCLALEQLPYINEKGKQKISMDIMNQVDSIIESLYKMVPDLQPLIDWFQTERVRIGPGDIDEVLEKTSHVFMQLHQVLKIYTDVKLKSEKMESEHAAPDLDTLTGPE